MQSEKQTKVDEVVKDDLDIAKEIDEKLSREEEIEDLENRDIGNINMSLTEVDMHLYGDKMVIAKIIQLISYIRHAVKNNLECEISVETGRYLANAEFMFDVNRIQVADLKPAERIVIT